MKLFDIAAKTHAKPMQTELGVKWAGTCPACDAKNSLHITQARGVVSIACIWCNITDDEVLAPLETCIDDIEVLEDELEIDAQKHLRGLLAREEAKARLVRLQAIEEVSAIQSVSAKELLAEEIPEVPYRVDRLWPVGGNVVLSAQAKAGKSTLAMNLTRALVTGQRFLGEFETSKPTGKIAIIDLELSRSHLQSWLGSIGVDTDQVVVYPMRGRASAIAKAMLDPQARSEFATDLREQGVEVLIIDPLSVLLNGAGIDENSNTEVGGMLRNGIAGLREDAGISDVLVIHHSGHGAKGRTRGASVILDWPDAIWTLTVDDSTTDAHDDEVAEAEGASSAPRFLKAVGRDVDIPETALRFDTESKRLVAEKVGTSRSRLAWIRTMTRREKLLIDALVAADGNAITGRKEWENLSKVTGAKAGRPIENLINSGMVEIVGEVVRGKPTTYRLSDEGRALVDAGSSDPGAIGAQEFQLTHPAGPPTKGQGSTCR